MSEENIIKKTCRELNVTQKELAKMMGVNEGTPAQWSSKGDIPDMALLFMSLLVKYNDRDNDFNQLLESLQTVDKITSKYQGDNLS